MPSELHLKAEGLREVGDFDKALESYQRAIGEYVKAENYAEAAEGFGGVSLTFTHLYEANPDKKIYLIIARHFAMLSLKLMIRYHIKDRIFRAYFRLAEAEMLRRHYHKAALLYRIARRLSPKDTPEYGNILYHLGFAETKAGDQNTGLLHMFIGREIIANSNDKLENYVYNVWLSGANMRLAQALSKDDPLNARKYFQNSLDIINSDDRLTLRRAQLEKIGQHLNYPQTPGQADT